MTIMVTGAAGYIGSQIVHSLSRLHDQPHVIGVDNLSTGHTCPLPRGFECFHGDVGHEAFIDNLLARYKVKQIIHCAAKVIVPESVEKPLEYYQNNTAASLTLIRAARRANVDSFIFSSTAAVYGQELVNRPLKENDVCRPCSPYGHSKLMVEQMLKDNMIDSAMAVVVLRYFNVAGADPLGQTGQFTEHASHLVSRAVRAGLGLIPMLQVYGDGTDVRDYVHVADLARAHIQALDWCKTYGPGNIATFNVGSGRGYSVNDVIKAVSASVRHDVPVVQAQRREGDPFYVVADTNFIKSVLDWEPRYDLRTIVGHAIAWERHRSYRGGKPPCGG